MKVKVSRHALDRATERYTPTIGKKTSDDFKVDKITEDIFKNIVIVKNSKKTEGIQFMYTMLNKNGGCRCYVVNSENKSIITTYYVKNMSRELEIINNGWK